MRRKGNRRLVVAECRKATVEGSINAWAANLTRELNSRSVDANAALFAHLAARQPRIAEQRPALVAAKIVASATEIGCTADTYLKFLNRCPALLTLTPAYLKVALAAIKAAFESGNPLALIARYPALLAADPATLRDALTRGAKTLGVTPEQFKAAARRQPQILVMDQAEQASRLAKTAEALGLPFQSYVQAVLKQPQLAYQSPETIIAKVQRSSKALGVGVADFMQAALTLPSLLYTDPDTIAGKRPLLDALARACETTLRDLIVLAPTALARSSRALEARLAVAAAFPGRFKANTLISMTEAQIAAVGGSC